MIRGFKITDVVENLNELDMRILRFLLKVNDAFNLLVRMYWLNEQPIMAENKR